MHARPKINQAGRCLPRYARISIKRHGSNQRVEVPVPLAGGGLPTLSNALPVSARNLYGPTLLPAVEKTAALPSSKFGISRPLNILRGYFAPQNAPLPSLPPCASAVPVASPLRGGSLSLSLLSPPSFACKKLRPPRVRARWSLTSHTSCPRRRKRSHAFFPFGRRRLDLCPLANEKNACDVGSRRWIGPGI